MIHTHVLAALLVHLASLAQQPGSSGLPSPDPALQAGLRQVLAARDPTEQRAALELLRAGAGPAHARLVPQLFLFLQEAHDTREGMLPGLVLKELAVPAGDVVGALAPLLEGADRPLRRALGRVLSQYEDRSVERGADFSVYRPMLEREPPPGLVRYLVESDPHAAFLLLARTQVTDVP